MKYARRVAVAAVIAVGIVGSFLPAAADDVPPEVQALSERVRAVGEYVGLLVVEDAVYALQTTVGDYLASIPAPVSPRPPALVTPAASGSGPIGECGGATNGADQFIGRESGGDPYVWNTGGSGAWGCYQIMPATWAGAGCNELGAHGSAPPDAQAACASRLSLSAWGG